LKIEKNSDNASLRNRAEERLKKKKTESGSTISAADTLKLLHELEVHQIELEMQNEELTLAKKQAEAATEQYVELYDFAPVGYFTLDEEGKIIRLNLMGSVMFGKERAFMMNMKFALLVSKDTRTGFNQFLARAFQGRAGETCNVEFSSGSKHPLYARLSGIVTENGKQCFVTAMDITELKLAEDEIRTLLSEKELLLREVHHRIKNNMNTITGLISMEKDSIANPAVISALRDVESRVQSIMLVHDKLYSSNNFRELSLKTYLVSLTEQILACFSVNTFITANFDVTDSVLSVQILTPVGIIVNEILTNIMKYAFAGREEGVITVAGFTDNNMLVISIHDDGIGLPESVDFENSTGFGMQLVSLLTKQLGGSITIERCSGTKFVLRLNF